MKLFLFFQPFSDDNNFLENKCEFQEGIIKKIYDLKQNKITGHVFFTEKVRFTLIYFHEALKNLKNLQTLLHLRMLFLGIEDWNYFSQLEVEILEVIDHPFVKMLKVAEFHLFNDSLSRGFVSERKKLFLAILGKNSPNLKSSRELKIKTFLETILTK